MSSLKMVLTLLADASLALNRAKCEFRKATVTYLGKQVGKGQVLPVDAKVEAIVSFSAPTIRRELRCFLGMVGYYRCYPNLSDIVAPLTKLCSPVDPLVWTEECENAFQLAKSLVHSGPVLAAPTSLCLFSWS